MSKTKPRRAARAPATVVSLGEIDLAPYVTAAIREAVEMDVRDLFESEMRAAVAARSNEIVRSVDFRPVVAEAVGMYVRAVLPGIDFDGQRLQQFVRSEVTRLTTNLILGSQSQ